MGRRANGLDDDDLSRAERSERTRLRLLEAGLDLWNRQPTERVFDDLEAKAVCARAGVTTGAFYHHFEDGSSFVTELLEHALTKNPNPPFAAAVPEFERQLEEGSSFAQALIAACEETLRFQDTNTTFPIELAVWSKTGRDPRLVRLLDRMDTMVEHETGTYYALVLEALGREMRPPYETEDLAAVFLALFKGLSLRKRTSRDRVPPRRFGSLMIPILLLMTRPVGDEQDADEWIAANAPTFPG